VAADELVASDGRRRARALELGRLIGSEEGPHTVERPHPHGAQRPEAALAAVRAASGLRAGEELRQARTEDALAIEDRGQARVDVYATLGPGSEQPTFSQAFSSMLRFDEVSFSVGLVVSWAPAGNAQTAAADRAAIERRRAGLALEMARRDLDDRARKLIAAIDGAARRSELAREATQLAQRAVVAEQARFEAGTVPAKNVLDRQVELAQAELREARVETDAAVASAELEGLTGENLARYSVH
jgi:outer membrane protein TolC